MPHRKLADLLRKSPDDLQHVGGKKPSRTPVVNVDDTESVELRDLIMKNILRQAKFLLQDVDQAPLVLLVLLLPVRRLHRNLFGDDPVANKVFEERRHEGARPPRLCPRTRGDIGGPPLFVLLRSRHHWKI